MRTAALLAGALFIATGAAAQSMPPAATAWQVNLTWNAPASSPDPVAGYNAYRSPSGAGAWQQINSAVIASSSYGDLGVQTGTAYDYIVESVDAEGVESAPSNIATVTVPGDLPGGSFSGVTT